VIIVINSTLFPEQIFDVQTKINAHLSRRQALLEVKEIHADEWKQILNPCVYGGRFYQTVANGLLKHIRFYDFGRNNHAIYHIYDERYPIDDCGLEHPQLRHNRKRPSRLFDPSPSSGQLVILQP
jgi:hypothetical protein